MIESGKWKKSTRSNGTGGSNCVEVTANPAGTVYVRNSRERRVITAFTPAEWEAFIAGVKDGEFDLPASGT